MVSQIQQPSFRGAPRVLLIGEDARVVAEIAGLVHDEFQQAVVSGIVSAERLGARERDDTYDLCVVATESQPRCLSAVEWMRRHQRQCPLLLVLGFDQEELAAEVTRLGVEDYVLKTPHYQPRLRAVVSDLIHSRRKLSQTPDSPMISAQQFRDVVENSAQGILIQVDDRPVYANAALARMLGHTDPKELLVLDSVYDFVDSWDLPRLRRITAQHGAGREPPPHFVFRARRRDGGLVWLENRVNEASWNKRPAVQWNMVDVSDRQRAMNALRLATSVARRVDLAGDFDMAIGTALRWLARGMGWEVAESWIPASDGALEPGPVWCGNRHRFRGFIAGSRGQRFKPGEGLPGRVLMSGLPEWMEDVSVASGYFRRCILANEAGLRSACAIPVIAHGRTIAVLCFFMSESLPRSEQLVAALSAGAASLGPVMNQIEAENERRANVARTEVLISRNLDGILVVNDRDEILFANPAAEKSFGRSLDDLKGMRFGAPSMGQDVAEVEIHNPSTGANRVNEMRFADIHWDGEKARLVSLRDVTERLETRKALENHQAALQERVKELRCLYRISNELARTDAEWDEVLRNIVADIPPGWFYPESTCARLRVEDREVVSKHFQATKWSLICEVRVDTEAIGVVEVFYLEEKPERDIGPFLKEERHLLEDIARRIGQAVANRRYQEALQDSRRRFQDFAEAASDWLWEMDEHLRFSYFSERIEAVMGQPVSHWLGKAREELTGDGTEEDPKWRRHRADLEARRAFRDFRYTVALPGGSVKHIAISGVPVYDDQGKFRGYRGTGTDETRTVEAHDRAWESEHRLQTVADRLPGVVFQRLRKPDGRIEYPYLSAGVERILGYSAEELQNDPLIWTDLIHPDDRPRFEVAVAESGKTLEPMDFTFRMAPRAGEDRWVWHRSRPRRLANGDTLWDCIELDITKQKKAEARVQYLGYHDQLTGMPNRQLFVERVDQVLPLALRNEQTVAVAMLGLKRFKQVNEEFGMAGGDEVLRVAAERFKDCLRPGDTVARLGGDRFLLLLPSVNENPTTHKPFDRLLRAMDQPIIINHRQILVTFNMGIAVFPRDGRSAEELIQKADTAQAHFSRWGPGYGYTFYQGSMPSSETSKLALEKELSDGIESPDQLKAYFQPLYEAATGRLTGVETLARWMHPNRGLVAPGEFIQLAEDTGLINPLGLKILRQACAEAGRWRVAGLSDITVSVNLSAKQIRDPHLAGSIKNILDETRMPPERLVLEVTESTLIADLDYATQFMEELVAEGVKFSLDDFGVGYSSLSYLGRLPVHSLKIDRSFVRDLRDDPRGESTIKAVVALAHALDLNVTAEGIETTEQLEHVKQLGCDCLQGFLLGRPMPADELGSLLAAPGAAGGGYPGQVGASGRDLG